jgi:beta-lactamase superfamily II metal-dependent hydrolase
VGEPLPAWSEGCLDIHAINSGRGECTFFVLPDGTSLCVDAGEIAPAGGNHPRVDAKPDVATRAYKVYSEYIKAYLPKGDTSMDYMLMTHFHNDHFGTTNAQEDYPMDSRDGYKYPLTGIMALYDEVPFDKIIDRAFDENSNYVTDVPATGQDYSDGYGYYGQFVTWARAKKGLVVEKAVNGSDSQLALVNKPSGYPDFKIQINAVNGWYWNGSKSVDAYSVNRLLGKQPGENGNSISFLLSYGDFDYLTSGDAGANTRIENNLAKSINRKIEAMKAHHHFAWETMSATSMAIYEPTVVVSQGFYDHQPDMGHQWLCDDVDYTGTSTQAFQTAWNAYSGEKHWFFTNIHPTTASTYPYEVAKMAGQNGHVVIRVAKNAEFYYVYMLDDTDMNYNVKSIHGPFTCHK